jgi:8-oxo-dGTP pyrophosphatase MutT (NUDIX family)
MGGAWVFPGGAVHDGDDGHAGAAIRELEEEAGLTIDAAQDLLGWSRWITPPEVKIRFDTFFFVVEAPPGAEPRIDGAECVDMRWIRPADALAAYERDEMTLVFPTIKHLEELAEFRSVAEVLKAARGRSVEAVTPRVVVGDRGARVLLPGEAGYDEAGAGTQPRG